MTVQSKKDNSLLTDSSKCGVNYTLNHNQEEKKPEIFTAKLCLGTEGNKCHDK